MDGTHDGSFGNKILRSNEYATYQAWKCRHCSVNISCGSGSGGQLPTDPVASESYMNIVAFKKISRLLFCIS
jgi:hypothetical protein